jgi:hypothetical protein
MGGEINHQLVIVPGIETAGIQRSSTSTVPGIETAGIQSSISTVPGIETTGIQSHQLVQSQE